MKLKVLTNSATMLLSQCFNGVDLILSFSIIFQHGDARRRTGGPSHDGDETREPHRLEENLFGPVQTSLCQVSNQNISEEEKLQKVKVLKNSQRLQLSAHF